MVQAAAAAAAALQRLAASATTTATASATPTQPTFETRLPPASAVFRHVAAVFPANSQTGLATLRAVVSYPTPGDMRDHGVRVVAIVRTPEAAEAVRKALPPAWTASPETSEFVPGIAPIEIRVGGDFANPKACADALRGVTRAFLIPPSSADRADLTINAMNAAKQAGVRHIVLLSVAGLIESSDASSFGKQFAAMEKHLAELRVAHTVLRAASFMDNLVAGGTMLYQSGQLRNAMGTGAFAPVAVADVGRAAAAVLTSEDLPQKVANVFTLTGPAALTSPEIAAILTKTLGTASGAKTNHTITHVSLTPSERAAELGWAPKWLADGLVELECLVASGAFASIVSIDVKTLTGGVHTSMEDFCLENRSRFVEGLPPRVCVFPAAGTVGNATLTSLVWAARNNLVRVRAVVRDPAKVLASLSDSSSSSNVEVVKADFNNPAAITAALTGVDRLLFVPPGLEQRKTWIAQALGIAKECNVSHVVLSSLIGAQLSDNVTAMRDFGEMERELENAGVRAWTKLRLGNFASNILGAAVTIRDPAHAFFGAAGLVGAVAPTDPLDVGEVAAQILLDGWGRHQSQAYDVTGPVALTQPQMAQVLSEVLGFPVTYGDLEVDDFGKMMVQWGVSPWLWDSVLRDLWVAIRANELCFVSTLTPKFIGKHRAFRSFVERNREVFSSS